MIASTRTINALNRLLAILYRSFPAYMADAYPWTHEGNEQALGVLADIVTDQQALCARVAEMVGDLGGRVDTGEFPMEFTDTNFLSLDFLLKELVRYQKQDLSAIQQVVGDLANHRQARELAEEALGSSRAHLESLETLVRQPA